MLDPLQIDLSASDGDPWVLGLVGDLDRGAGSGAVLRCLAHRTVAGLVADGSGLGVGDCHDVRPISRMDGRLAQSHGTLVSGAPRVAARRVLALAGLDGERTGDAPMPHAGAAPGSGVSIIEPAEP